MGKCHALAWNAVAPVFGDVERPRLAMLAESSQALADSKARRTRLRARHRRLALARERSRTSTWCRSRRPTRFIPTWRSRRFEAGKHVWCEKPMATKLADAERDARGGARVRQGRGARLQLHPEPDDPPDPAPPRRGPDRRRQSCARRDGRGFHGRSGGALLLEERGLVGPWRVGRFRRPSLEPDLRSVRRAFVVSALTCRSPMRIVRCKTAAAAPSRPTISPPR